MENKREKIKTKNFAYPPKTGIYPKLTSYIPELPKIFEPPFGLKPKILSCSLRLTKEENQNLKITKLRIV